jgi:hypothetical protein
MTKAKIYLCLNYLTSPHNSCIKNETRVREAEGIFKIEVPDNIRKIVIVKAQVHVVMTYVTPPLLFLSLYIDLFTNLCHFAIKLFLRFSILLYR